MEEGTDISVGLESVGIETVPGAKDAGAIIGNLEGSTNTRRFFRWL